MQDDILETTDEAPSVEYVEDPTEVDVEDAPEVEVSTQADQQQVPAVQILVFRDEGGNIECDVAATGDVRPTEVETVIKMGLNKWRGKIGLPG